MGMDDICSPGLILGLGFPPSPLDTLPRTADKLKPPSSSSHALDLDPCLALSLSGNVPFRRTLLDVNKASSFDEESGGGGGGGAASSPLSGVSSFSTAKAATASVKRERETSSDDAENERVSSKASDEEDDLGGGGGSNARKKLRLSKDQSALLEESFKQHSTLNPKQKQILARQLNLRPRQVEVWFQNRRARTKLKQTEVDCELLKKCCETLSDENRRLQKELQELKSLKLAQPFYMHVPAAAATLTMCPSCERVCGGGDNKSPKSPFSMAPTATTAAKPQFYAHLHQFTNPSAAC